MDATLRSSLLHCVRLTQLVRLFAPSLARFGAVVRVLRHVYCSWGTSNSGWFYFRALLDLLEFICLLRLRRIAVSLQRVHSFFEGSCGRGTRRASRRFAVGRGAYRDADLPALSDRIWRPF